MAKVLKITKPDKTVHVVPIMNKGFYQAYNNRQPSSKKWKIEEIDESEAKNLPFIDESHVSPMEAVQKVTALEATLSAKDKEIEALKKQLADAGNEDKQTDPPVQAQTAADKITAIKVAESVEAVQLLLEGETRKSVLTAGAAKVTELSSE